MSIGSFLLTPDNLNLVQKNSWKFGRRQIVDIGMGYYEKHPAEVEQIASNLAYFDLPSSGAALDEVLKQMVVHYYEKLFVLTKTYEAFWIAKNRIDMGDALDVYRQAQNSKKAVFIGQSHFGGTYLMAMALMVHGIDLATVAKFPEPAGSMLQKSVRTMRTRYGTGEATLLNLADPSVDVPGEMIRVLLRRGIVSNVFDENNKFCKPVSLLGQKIMGGTGMDLILKNFSDDKVTVVTPFLVRTSDESFRYELDRHELSAGDIVSSFFDSLEKRIRDNYAQWYFIHEVHENFIGN